MECHDVRRLIEVFIAEECSVETTASIVAHLEHCPACRAEVEGLRRLRTAARSAFERSPDLAPSPAFSAALRTRLRAKTVAPPSWLNRRGWLAAAASVVVAAGTGWGWREYSLSGLSSLVRRAVGDHRFCALDFKLTENPIELEEAARRYGAVNALLSDVEPSSANLSGGALRIVERHSCVYEGTRFMHIVLLYKNQSVSLLIADDRSRTPWGPGATPSTLPQTDGFQVAAFHGDQHAVFLVSSLNDTDLEEVATAMYGPINEVLKQG